MSNESRSLQIVAMVNNLFNLHVFNKKKFVVKIALTGSCRGKSFFLKLKKVVFMPT